MDELKIKTMEIITEINNDWVQALRKAEEEDGILDISENFSKFTEKIQKLDKYFIDAKDRVKGSAAKKGRWSL